ncbi:MAG: glycoside hydrolase family 3 C-terminal domain-containing protein [Candidatus Sumerlaeia bacterium]
MEKKIQELLSQMTLYEKCVLLAGKTPGTAWGNERLGVPSIALTDSPHGVRKSSGDLTNTGGQFCTTFATGSASGATWNPDLIREVGKALGEEARGKDAQVVLGPTMNIVRHPLGGRSFETYSEDPCLAGEMACGYVEGLQSMNVGCSLKHFCANNQEQERFRNNSIVDERALREIYLPHFETVVKRVQPWTIMCAYNRVNGTYMAEKIPILRHILKDEWGFDGVVVSDWGACHSTADSIRGGLDLEMPGPGFYYDAALLTDQVENRQLDEALINDAAARMLRLILRTTEHDGKSYTDSILSEAHVTLARRQEEEAIVLLKNDADALPLLPEKTKRLAIIGPNAAKTFHTGGGSSAAKAPYVVSVLEGMQKVYGDDIEIIHESGCDNYTHMRPPLETDWVRTPDGKEAGFLAEYFSNPFIDGEPDETKVDALINCWWCRGREPVMGPHSVRWTAKVTVPQSGRYYIGADHTSDLRLFIDGKAVIDDQVIRTSPEGYNSIVSTTVDLEADRDYDLICEFRNPTVQLYPHLKIMAAYIPTAEEEDAEIAKAREAAKSSDAALVVVGGMEDVYESEGKDRPTLDLPGRQDDLIRAVAAVNKRTIVVINTGSPVAMPWVDDVAAVVHCWYGGLEIGNAVANVLSGKVNPSGHLPVTFPKRIEDTPAYGHFPGGEDIFYGEGIFVGYRWYDARGIEPLFPFGHGLSYTQFEYADLKLEKQKIGPGEKLGLSFILRNTGKKAGAEVAQIYVQDLKSQLARPPKELKAFRKVWLAPGEEQTLELELSPRAFQYWHPEKGGWLAEAGEFRIHLAASATDIRLTADLKMQ